MSRPRKPFGAKQPGRLPSTMMKVLAAEMSDPQRLRRGKQYAHDGSVTDIVVEEGPEAVELGVSEQFPPRTLRFRHLETGSLEGCLKLGRRLPVVRPHQAGREEKNRG